MAIPSVYCYAQPGKQKSRLICEAFARGAGGEVVDPPDSLKDAPAAFYGIVGLEHLYRQALQREFFYVDNAYFDVARGTHFRVGHNALQDAGAGEPEWARSEALGLKVEPWRRDGRHVLVVVQSEHFMREVAMWPGGVLAWQNEVLHRLKACTDRPIVVRHWMRDKRERAKTLHQDLLGAWAVVGHMTAALNEALLAGVPVFATGSCAASRMGLSQLESIEYPRRPDGRSYWAAALAAKQWTLQELEEGAAWRAMK